MGYNVKRKTLMWSHSPGVETLVRSKLPFKVALNYNYRQIVERKVLPAFTVDRDASRTHTNTHRSEFPLGPGIDAGASAPGALFPGVGGRHGRSGATRAGEARSLFRLGVVLLL